MRARSRSVVSRPDGRTDGPCVFVAPVKMCVAYVCGMSLGGGGGCVVESTQQRYECLHVRTIILCAKQRVRARKKNHTKGMR